jgi:uridine phosphorylase
MYPNFPDKHLYRSIIEPDHHLEYRKFQGKYPSFAPPKGVIFCYQNSFLEHVLTTHAYQACDGFLKKLYFLSDTQGEIAILGSGLGAPAASMKLEQLIAWGVKRFVSVGTAGSLQQNVKVGDFVLCERAIRDEGTSHHYLPAAKYAFPSVEMTEKICYQLEKESYSYHFGTSWTLDTLYRETIEETKHYQEEGVLTVEMEAAALFAVAQYRNVELGALFTISDSLAHLEWHPEFHNEKTHQGLEAIYRVAIDVLKE